MDIKLTMAKYTVNDAAVAHARKVIHRFSRRCSAESYHRLEWFLMAYHDEDERQSTQDRDTYHSPIESIFEPVPFPKWLLPRRRRRKRS